MKSIYAREMKSYFYSLHGWLFLAVFLSLGSLIFYLNNLMQHSSNYLQFLSMMSYVWMLLSPILSMRLIAGEKRSGTDKLLMSSPISMVAVVLGKYLAAVSMLALSMLLSFVYPLLLSFYAKIYLPEILTAYIGFFLQGCAFIAMNLAVTSSMKSTMAAGLIAFGTNLMVWMASLMVSASSIKPWLAQAIAFFSLYQRFTPFLGAQLSFSSIFYFLVFIACMLGICINVLDLQRRKRT